MPCRKMDKTTWVDETVVKWLEEHAVTLQFDVDKEKKLFEQLKIKAMPTLIVYKEGEEFDRAIGYKTADELLE